MRGFTLAGGCLFFSMLAGCANPNTPPSTPKPPPVATPVPKTPPTFLMRGTLVAEQQLRSFTPCDSQQQFLLHLPEQLNQTLAPFNEPAHQRLYAELIGYLAPPSKTGYNGDYLGQFVVQQINQISIEQAQACQSVPQATRALGTEPFWSLTYQKEGFLWQAPGMKDRLLHITTTQLSSKQRVYRFAQGELTLTQQFCSDNMSDTLYGWQAHFTMDNEQWQGCATLANRDSSQEWAGQYVTAPNAEHQTQIIAQFNTDHSAQFYYPSTQNNTEVVETGFWQALSPDQIQTTITRYQQQYLIAERVFSRKGNQLIATEEKIGDRIYSISQGGLVLYPALGEVVIQQQKDKPKLLQPRPPKTASTASSAEFNAEVDHAVRRYFSLHRTKPDNMRYRWLKYDLDGDQQPELLVMLDWCAQKKCTLLIFQQQNQQWRFTARINQMPIPFWLGKIANYGWQDLLIKAGTDEQPVWQRLAYDGVSYPVEATNFNLAPAQEASNTQLFVDGISPKQQGVKL